MRTCMDLELYDVWWNMEHVRTTTVYYGEEDRDISEKEEMTYIVRRSVRRDLQ